MVLFSRVKQDRVVSGSSCELRIFFVLVVFCFEVQVKAVVPCSTGCEVDGSWSGEYASAGPANICLVRYR